MVRTIMTTALLVAVVCVSMLHAETMLTFSGDVQYRIRYDIWNETEGDIETDEQDYSYRYWWNLFAKAVVNENLMFGIRLSNPLGYYTDAVTGNDIAANRFGMAAIDADTLRVDRLGLHLASVPEFYFQWSPVEAYYLMAGIIPVPGNTVLDLVAWERGGYKNAGLFPWVVAFNKSQIGAQTGVALTAAEDISVGINFMTTIIEETPKRDEAEDVFSADQHRFIVTAPVALEALKLTIEPTLHFRTGIVQSADLEEGNNSVAVGGDLKFAPTEDLFASAGYAFGTYSNSAVADPPLVPQESPTGQLVNLWFTWASVNGKAISNLA
jgi:hypothetical protein